MCSEILSIPRVMIAGTHSGVGKTTIATGIMAALANKGLPIQAYKVGPDYIDPSYHTLATGRTSRNLDRWLLRENLLPAFEKSARGCWAVMEGVMGLFDGVSGTKGYGSSADIAKLLDTPVVLLVDAGNMSRSIAALVQGYATFDPDLKIAGVILNRVKSLAQETLLWEALEEIEIPILGVLSTEEGIRLPERHLGLVPSQEKSFREEFFEDLTQVIFRTIDLARLQDIMLAGRATRESVEAGQGINRGELMVNNASITSKQEVSKDINKVEKYGGATCKKRKKPPLRLGVAWDEAFSFYYQDALDCAENLGFNLIRFSPLHDQVLPKDLDAVMFGGGFPEMHLEKLNQNQTFMASLREFSSTGKTIYAECGGYMYLGQQITNFTGKNYAMVGLIPIKSKMTKKLQGMGYRRGVFQGDSFLGDRGTEVYGHEFHYSKVDFLQTIDADHSGAYALYKGEQVLRIDGYAQENIFASYLHLNFAGHPQLMERWAEYIRQGA